MGAGLFGNDDTFVLHWGPFEIPIPYGNNS
jgi:hypothetical protein